MTFNHRLTEVPKPGTPQGVPKYIEIPTHSQDPQKPEKGPQRYSKESQIRATKRGLDQKLGTFDFAIISYTLSTLGSPKGYPNSIKKGLQNDTVFLTSKSKPRGPKMVPKGTPNGSQNGIKFNPWSIQTPLRAQSRLRGSKMEPQRSPNGPRSLHNGAHRPPK